MSVKKVAKHPKQLIIDHYDSLVNKLDVYVEQLMEKYGDDELLEESESRALTKDDYKKSDFKIEDDDDEDEKSENEEVIEKDNSSSGEEGEEDDSEDEDIFDLLERRYIYRDYSEDENDANECEDSEEDEDEENDDEYTEVDENEDTGVSEDDQREEDKKEKEEDIKIDQEDKESKLDKNEEKKDECDQKKEDQKEEEIDQEDKESEEKDDRWMDDNLNKYSYYEYNEWDENVEDIEDDEVYEALSYGIKKFTVLESKYDFDYKTDKHAQFELKESRSSIKTRDYLNQVRSFMIDEIRKAETQQLESYEANKAGFEFDKNSSIGEMKKEIFKDRFCFLIDTKTDQIRDDFLIRQKKNRVFNVCFIITDFYLSRSQFSRIKSYFDYVKELPFDYLKKSDFILNEKNLFLQYVMQKIRCALRANGYRLEMMYLTKSYILEQCKMDFCFMNIPSVSLAKPLTIDFSCLKSLDNFEAIKRDHYGVNYNNCEVEDLSGLPNLEYLEIKKMFINKRAFIGLEKLIKLVLDCCKVEEKNLDENMLISQKNRLEFLQINDVEFYLTLDSLKSLRVLSLFGVNNFKYIKSIPTENLQVLHLNTNRGSMYIDLDEIGRFFKRSNLTNVHHFRLSGTEFENIENKWLSVLTNASRLVLCNNSIESAKFLKRLNLSNLTNLDLRFNNIKNFEQSYFKGLTNLTRLNLSANPLKRLKPGVFSELKNLTTLFLQNIKNLEIEKDSFLGLNNLRILDFSHSIGVFRRKSSSVKSIDEAAFDHLSGLKSLRVKSYNLKLKDVSRLKYLEEIVLYENDLSFYKFDFKAGLNFKVIEGY